MSNYGDATLKEMSVAAGSNPVLIYRLFDNFKQIKRIEIETAFGKTIFSKRKGSNICTRIDIYNPDKEGAEIGEPIRERVARYFRENNIKPENTYSYFGKTGVELILEDTSEEMGKFFYEIGIKNDKITGHHYERAWYKQPVFDLMNAINNCINKKVDK